MFDRSPAPSRPIRTGRVRFEWLDAAVLGAIFGLGVAHAAAPFGGDQFLYLLGAQKIAHHGVLYRDFWDLKQPLIYYWYAAAGTLLGFHERGIHLFEALYQTCFSALLIAACAARMQPHWVASVVPLMTVGVYYAFASNYALTSVEALAGFPIFGAACFAGAALRDGRGGTAKALVAGCCGGIAAALKLLFLPLVVALWITALARSGPAGGAPQRRRTAALLVLGCALPLAIFGVYFAVEGVIGVALRTTFVDPPQIVRTLAPADHSPLWPQARAFGQMMLPLFLLAVAGAAALRRNPDVLGLQMVVWTIAGVALIGVQIWSYDYRFYILVVPVGVLAARGLGVLFRACSNGGAWPRAAGLAVLVALVAAFTQSAFAVRAHWNGWARQNQLAAAASAPFVRRARARPGPIYIFGNPRLYYYSGRDQAVAINGWSPQLLLPSQWRELRRELASAAPAYIIIDSDYAHTLRASPEMRSYLAASYRVAFVARDGLWYERR